MPDQSERWLEEIVARIRRACRPERILLFGSRARGEDHPNSDYDVLVIQESNQPRYQRAVRLYQALADLPVEIEVLVYTPHEVEDWSAVPEAFITTAIREGKLLYEDQG